jgi:tetratricopeptide (TPR) repeat protein
MSNKDDWFRSSNWDEESRLLFESKLARSKTGWNRAQYLRIKGLMLLTSDDPDVWEGGVALSERVIRDYGDAPERSEAALAYDALGDHYVRRGDDVQAERNYRLALKAFKGTNRASDTEIRLAELLVRSERYADALDCLEILPNDTLLNSQLYRLNVCLARILFHLGDHEQAPRNARRVLQLMEITEPQLPRHPTVGLVPQDDAVRVEMEGIIASCEA